MVGIGGPALTPAEEHLLRRPAVGGVILFSRNYRDRDQLAALCGHIRALRQPHLLIGVDHEGGRVQRFRAGFTPLPAMGRLGQLFDADQAAAVATARAVGTVLAAELRACGVDFSFTPVLDLDHGASGVIGDRAFHRRPEVVAELAAALLSGLRRVGMAGVGKHFPGHGFVVPDSHHELPEDHRSLAEMAGDLLPFQRLVDAGIAGIMPAHVRYPQVDAQPAGFSAHWLGQVLRRQMGFTGAVLSDDLGMAGAAVAGGLAARVHRALTAGCDLALVCNELEALPELVATVPVTADPARLARLIRLHGHGPAPAWPRLAHLSGMAEARALLERLAVTVSPAAAGVDPTAPARDA